MRKSFILLICSLCLTACDPNGRLELLEPEPGLSPEERVVFIPPVVSSGITVGFDALKIQPAAVTVYQTGVSLALNLFRQSDGSWSRVEEGAVSWAEWKSDDPGIVSVSPSGVVTTVAPGETRVRIGNQSTLIRVVAPPKESVIVSDTSRPQPESPEKPREEPKDSPEEPKDSAEDPIIEVPPPSEEAPYADKVVSYLAGPGGGINEDKLPGIVLGPPKGAGIRQGSTDTFSLGQKGEIVLEFEDYIIFDGPGPDVTVFENAFFLGGNPAYAFAELGIVGVSEDGVTFYDFDCDTEAPSYAGCAGVHPVLANPDVNTIDPTDPSVSGGDSFDLKDVGLQTARFVRIRDADAGAPYGPRTSGFDLDAVAIVHGTILNFKEK